MIMKSVVANAIKSCGNVVCNGMFDCNDSAVNAAWSELDSVKSKLSSMYSALLSIQGPLRIAEANLKDAKPQDSMSKRMYDSASKKVADIKVLISKSKPLLESLT